MRAIVVTAVVAGCIGLSAGIWLKSTVLATAASVPTQAAAMLPHDMMRAAPADLPVVQVTEPF